MRRLLGGFTLGLGFQLRAMVRSADTYFALVGAPLTTVVLMSMMLYSGRTDLASYAVVAPTLMSLWTAGLMFAGEMISEDRENGRLEPLLASPVSLPSLVFGRLCGAMFISLPAFALAIVTAGLVFGVWITIHHPVVFVLAVLATSLATAATVTALSAVFIVAPGARIVQNSLSMPVFLLAGVMVPVALFPVWLEGASRVLYLSWGADLFRDALEPAPVEAVALRLLTMAALGAAALAFGSLTLVRFLRRARAEGTLSRV
ncbi:ABC transporter permease [Nocardiopsis ganjiahuensis]|uniref:ABC transporter permease n=1 Tax=Nocardiopsis ganjiahuensis TaxID=239984 RepID=UPI00034D0FFF|nr:ABC transporter permease [Nocardiopsis ganjiahuensis]